MHLSHGRACFTAKEGDDFFLKEFKLDDVL
jgi:hypothetical protein